MVVRKHSRRMRRTRRRVQRGAGWGFNGPAFHPIAGMVPEAARATIDTGCDAPERPAPQVGGGCGCMAAPPLQRGGGAGTGGYGFVLDNSMGGKVYSDLTRGACPSQSGGSMRAEPIVSYPSGYGYNTASAVEVGGGTAHYLEQVPYGRQCMGGGRHRASRKHRARKSHKKSCRHRK